MNASIQHSIRIHAPVSVVWSALTEPAFMQQWMAEREMKLEIITDWNVGDPIVIKAFHHEQFENRGTVLECIPEKVLRYNYLSSLSGLPDVPENYTCLEFRLTSSEEATILDFTAQTFPTETIFSHLAFYWGTTLVLLKELVEKR